MCKLKEIVMELSRSELKTILADRIDYLSMMELGNFISLATVQEIRSRIKRIDSVLTEIEHELSQ
jgi:hypothetical protein